MELMESNSEAKVVENEGVDRISVFPDLMLNKTLSYLTTKNAVAASILSTRWKNLSPFAAQHIIRLILDDTMLLHPKENESNSPSATFVEFVDKLFTETLSDVHCVKGMALRCDKDYGDVKILSWVCAALRLKLECLSFASPLVESYSLFVSLNGCKTLVWLVISLDSEFRIPTNFSLPNLKFLHLLGLDVRSEDTLIFSEFINGFPALEDLWLTGCSLSGLGIVSPRLKTFKMEDCLADIVSYFMLCAPNLEGLELNGYASWAYFSVSTYQSLRATLINVDPHQKLHQKQLDEGDNGYSYDDDGSWHFNNNVAKLVIACSNTSSLQLSGCSISALCGSSLKLPEFQNLTWLSLGQIGFDGWALLACLLQNAPNLDDLYIKGFTKDKDGFANFQKSMPVSPVCLELHMKRIELRVFQGNEDEMKLVEYFLKTGCVLEKLVLFVHPYDRSMFMRLHMMPRESGTCQIEFG